MRKIDRDAARAFWSGTRFRRSNTAVTVHKNVVSLYLHGNLIAERRTDRDWVMVTLAGWNTVTTRARLNAVLYMLRGYISQTQWVPYIGVNGHKREMDPYKWYQVFPEGLVCQVDAA